VGAAAAGRHPKIGCFGIQRTDAATKKQMLKERMRHPAFKERMLRTDAYSSIIDNPD
jgi:hypothetical protein